MPRTDNFLLTPRIRPRASEELSQKRFDELSKHLLKVSLVLVSFAFFCLLSLGQPDAAFIKSGGTVKMPFANVDVDFGAFFVIGPTVLSAILIYLHIMLAEWEKFGGRYAYHQRLIYFFNIPTPPSRCLSIFIFYILGPGVLLSFALRARGGGTLWVFVTIAYIAAMGLLGLYLWRREANLRKTIMSSIFLTIVFVPFLWPAILVGLLPLQVSRADLSGQDLRYFNLRGANASAANLSGSDLRSMNLLGIDLFSANLEGARMSNSIISGATLRDAKLRGADLSQIVAIGSDLSRADLFGVQLNYSQLMGADLTFALLSQADLSFANLQGADLSFANLQRADLSFTNLQGSNLRRANLEGASLLNANLKNANLNGADLSSTVLTQAQLNDACGDQTTKLPSSLTIGTNC
jgi:uncharacterized protein YjbI with pentapeptide repeats